MQCYAEVMRYCVAVNFCVAICELQVLELSLRTHHLEVELRDTKRHVKQLKKMCRSQQRHAQATERSVSQSAKTVVIYWSATGLGNNVAGIFEMHIF